MSPNSTRREEAEDREQGDYTGSKGTPQEAREASPKPMDCCSPSPEPTNWRRNVRRRARAAADTTQYLQSLPQYPKLRDLATETLDPNLQT